MPEEKEIPKQSPQEDAAPETGLQDASIPNQPIWKYTTTPTLKRKISKNIFLSS